MVKREVLRAAVKTTAESMAVVGGAERAATTAVTVVEAAILVADRKVAHVG